MTSNIIIIDNFLSIAMALSNNLKNIGE